MNSLFEQIPEIIGGVQEIHGLVAVVVIFTILLVALFAWLTNQPNSSPKLERYLVYSILFSLAVSLTGIGAASISFSPVDNLSEPSSPYIITLEPSSLSKLEEYLKSQEVPITHESKSKAIQESINLLVTSVVVGTPINSEQGDRIQPSNSLLSIESLTCEPRLPSYSRPVTIKKELLNPKHYIQADNNGIGLSCQIPNDNTSDFSQLALEIALEDQYQNTVDVNVYVDGEKTGFTTLNAGEGSKIINIDIKDASTFRIELKKVYGNYIVANVYFLRAELT